MSRITTITVLRQNVQVTQHIPVQIDNISLSVIGMSNGAIPVNSSMLYATAGVPDIQTGDELVDESTLSYNVDTRTNSGSIEYRVEGNPEPFDFNHLEVMVVRVVGK